MYVALVFVQESMLAAIERLTSEIDFQLINRLEAKQESTNYLLKSMGYPTVVDVRERHSVQENIFMVSNGI